MHIEPNVYDDSSVMLKAHGWASHVCAAQIWTLHWCLVGPQAEAESIGKLFEPQAADLCSKYLSTGWYLVLRDLCSIKKTTPESLTW